ncbi:type II toxin-antitoxin system HicB family antitoxin [Devosia neptuniae]|uniref:Type II toxin-antitoxin system HicB family antitoxin n=1 Tax=Devosia neptuniae TaxID=191302 RepID=A0ABY6CCP2_9HYPH|nr:type II toxin-antitoxin system HicB family antitoxin [Devosia neptuniae]UXN69887.1 type II toxin-antitoxin system HicB family antitoxin [Devosia neptuniae]
MKTVSYKGFQAAVEYEDGVLFVRVLHIEDLLVTQCKSVDEIAPALEELIEDYLQDCKALGKVPTKSFSGSFNVRVGEDLHRRAAVAAAERGCNLNTCLIEAVTEKLECDHLGSRFDTVFRDARQDMELLRLASGTTTMVRTETTLRHRRPLPRTQNAADVIKLAASRGSVWAHLDG